MTPFAFPPNRRLKTPDVFTRLFKQGRRLRKAPFVIFYASNNLPHARLGIAIAKRHVPHATDRNRIKRLIRESFRLNALTLNSLDIVIRSGSVEEPIKMASLRESIQKVWYTLSKQQNQT